jgi:hypothetical protein
MLKTAEVEIKKEHTVLMVNKSTEFKKPDRKTKGPKGKSRTVASMLPPLPRSPRRSPTSRASTAMRKEEGHWKRNCPKYLEDKKAVKIAAKDKGICDIHVIDICLKSARSNTWVFDTGSVAHISRICRVSGAWRGTR